jgi:hypothetical protein
MKTYYARSLCWNSRFLMTVSFKMLNQIAVAIMSGWYIGLPLFDKEYCRWKKFVRRFEAPRVFCVHSARYRYNLLTFYSTGILVHQAGRHYYYYNHVWQSCLAHIHNFRWRYRGTWVELIWVLISWLKYETKILRLRMASYIPVTSQVLVKP